MIDTYTAHMIRKRRSPNTIRLRRFYLTKFAAWYGRPLEDAQHDDFETYIFASRTWSQNTQQSATATLKSFYGWAHREGILGQNPTRDLAPIRVHRLRQRIASEEAIQHAVDCTDLTDRAMILLGAECGLRVSEIANLHQRHRDGTWLHVIGKGNKQRSLHMSPELARLLDDIEATTMRRGYYFPGQSGIQPIHPSTAWRHITAALASNPHSLRRRAGTVVYRRSGFDINLTKEFLGHEQTRTTEDYLDIRDDDLVRASALTRLAA